jgi:hypothetical protein
MLPFYFGDSDRPLFGIYSPANPAHDKQKALLICPPSFQEYMRTHRQLKQLAVSLSSRGIHVLRFDYSGCGDSAGTWENTSIDDWVKDISMAASELKALSMVDNLSFLGVRLGASLLPRADLESVPGNRFILWDPILDGEQYLESLTQLQIELVNDRSRFKMSRHSYLDEHELELVGYPVSGETKSQLAQINMSDIKWNDKQVLLLYSNNKEAYLDFAKRNVGIELKPLSLPCNWESLSYIESQVQVPELATLVNDFMI